MKHLHIATALLTALNVTAALAEVTEQEAIQSQVGSVMASADYAARKCPNLHIDQARLQALIKRSGMSAEALRRGEDYAEQRDVLESLGKSEQAAMLCSVLSSAHGGYARGIIE
ncbi:hypothetical protein IGB42_02845 [Andreprevotia sp. IGB-42]|uniref:hypothetical protein n=1 Tax=Andreprevotia sp. IGB-42 TaxID=2497473 RepID=UPI001356903E|nr:hypothetical protein [Andreprevotia sp. IGB-42]KAF0812556.1 hypothetical protein IGB42_02845 [Andreprevotia sp. IGB-42]